MQQFTTMWRNLTTTRKAVVVGSTIAIFLVVLGMSRLIMQPRMTLLYSGLDPAAAGEVVQSLEQRGSVYEVRGTSVYVAAAERDPLRLALANEGLPASSGQGYELLDSLKGYATTSKMFDAAYLRAKEGELARTILSSPDVSSARVHIATGGDNPFRRDLMPSASVHVTARSGSISATQAQAIRHLVASAVSGLSPESVSVIDAQAGLLAAQDGVVSAAVDQDRVDMLRERVLRLVEARVGKGNAVVEVSVDTVTDTESITERKFDPDSRFVISSSTEERSDQSENAASGAVTVASNLPDGDANGTDTETSQSSETREQVNYEVSQTTRELVKLPGAVKRLTVAVLVNGVSATDAQGAPVFEPLPQEELDALRELVASAVGFSEERGDAITLRSMAFEPVEELGTSATVEPWYSSALDVMSLIQLAVLALVALILGLFVVRPLFAPKRLIANEQIPQLAAAPRDIDADGPVLTGTIEPDDSGLVTTLANPQDAELSSDHDDPVARLKTLIEERRSETVEVLRSWLDEPQPDDAR